MGTARRTVWGRRQSWIFVGLIAALLGLSHLAYLRWTRPQPVDVEMLSPAQTWMLWQELRLGTNRVPSPAAREAAKEKLSHQVGTVFAVLVIAVGVLTMGAAYALIRPSFASQGMTEHAT
jgi:hypothetical protein